MASAFDKYLKKLGVGKKSKYQKEREASPVLLALSQRRQPTYDEIQEQKRINRAEGVDLPLYQGKLKEGESLKNIGGISYVVGGSQAMDEALTLDSSGDRFPIPGTQAQASMNASSSPFSIPGMQSQTPLGLFTSSTAPSVVEEPMSPVVEEPMSPVVEEPNIVAEDDRLVSGGIVGDVLLPERGEPREKPPLGSEQTYNPEEEVFGGIVGNVPTPPTSIGIVQTVLDKAQAAKDYAERQHQSYIENMKKRRQERASQMVIDMENQLMQQMMEKEERRKEQENLQKDYTAVADLESQIQAANDQMDKTNFYLQHSGLFGQRRNSPSYTSVVPQSSFGPSSTYAQPEYYSGDPFEIKRLYE